MDRQFSRTEILLGKEAMEKLKDSAVAVFGIGGVGSFTVEALARSGIGKLFLIDYDIIDITNINRQIHATYSSIGLSKVKVMGDRLLDINPELELKTFDLKYNEETKDIIFKEKIDYVVDAIDMVSAKIDLILECKNRNIPIISSMGAGNKLDPTMFKVSDIYKTKICPLAKVMRHELRKKGVKDLKVVWSEEEPKNINLEKTSLRKAVPGSTGFVPSVAGLILAAELIKDIGLQEV